MKKQKKGKGIFHANLSFLKHQNYKILINNKIYNEVLEAVNQNNSTLYNDARNNFLEMISVQEEIVGVEMLQSEINWPVNDRIAYQNSFLINIKSKVIPTNVLLN